jgi:hypothetical protein
MKLDRINASNSSIDNLIFVVFGDSMTNLSDVLIIVSKGNGARG